MNTAEYVDQQIEVLKNGGIPLDNAAWEAALLCVGWPYVFGASGQYCTVDYRKQAYARHGEKHPTIKTKCQVFNGKKSTCTGCKWYPNGKKVRCYDCRGFTYWILYRIYGFKLDGSGCTSQWNTASNWKAKGEVSDGIPQNTIVCLFYYKKDSKGRRTNTLEHTGLYYNGETCECSNGVEYSKKLDKKWEVWAVPVCAQGGVTPVPPEPTPQPGYAVVTGNRLALREGPTTSAKVLTRLEHGSTVKIEPVPADWEYVSAGNRKGFVMKQYIKEG